MLTVGDFLKTRSGEVWAISPQATVFDALKVLADKDVGALPVVENEKLIGIFSERDYARKIILKGKTSIDTSVWEIMSQNVVTVMPQHTLDECMALMTNERVRHLPVMAEDKVVGIISIGDVVKALLQQREQTIHHLENYILNEGYGQ
jgi:CBS domain-containing protein